MRNRLMMTVALLLAGFGLAAQNMPAASINLAGDMAKVKLAYKNKAYLSFDVRYRFALETNPAVVVDSLPGSFKMSGSYYWGILDSNEYMQNHNLALQVYKAGSIITVANPQAADPEPLRLGLLDSMLGKNSYTVSGIQSGASRTLLISFSGSSFAYKNMAISYDTATGLLNQVRYTIKDDYIGLSESYDYRADANSSPYVVVTMDYFNYSTAPFANTVFLTENYIIKNGTVYEPASGYSGYQVFITTPQLLK